MKLTRQTLGGSFDEAVKHFEHNNSISVLYERRIVRLHPHENAADLQSLPSR